MEEWKDIKGYESLYKISNYGNIKSYHKKEKLLKLNTDKNGYVIVALSKNGKKHYFKLHRLVAQTFIDNPNNYPQINHKDENKRNNNVNNLEWCTSKYNNNYGTRINKVKRKLSKCVYQYTLDNKLIKKWNSLAELKKQGYCISKISETCNHKDGRRIFNNYIWKYEDEVDLIVDLLNNL